MTMAEVRLLILEDANIFYQLRLRAVREETRSFMESEDEVIKKPAQDYFKNGWIAGAFIDGKLIGNAGLFRFNGKKIAHKGRVWGVYVAPEARGQGIARRLINLLINEAQKAGLELIQISTDNTNQKTQMLYQSLGFALYGVEKHIMKLADGSYVDDVLMAKVI